MNVATILQMAADGHPDRIGVGTRANGISYGRLSRLVASGAARLGADTEVVAFVGQSGYAFVTAFFASAARGIPFVPLNYRLGTEQLGALLARHELPLIIADPQQYGAIPDAEGNVITTEDWLAGLDDSDRGLDIAEPATPALYLYTSGTNAAPKAAVLHHRHLAAYIFSSVEFASAQERDAALVSVPPYHIAGVANLLSNVFSGRRVVYLPTFEPANWLATVRSEHITQAMVVPTMLARVVEAVGTGTADTPSLRLLSYGGARMHESVLRRALRAFPDVGFVNAYGLTETSSSIAVLGPAEHRAALDSADPVVVGRLSSAGRVLPGIEIQIRDESGQPLAAGVVGDVWVRGDQVSGEYAGGGSVCDADGWFPTRDAGWLDEENYLFVEGRTDDTIIRGGENIAPAEVEDVLLRHPAVLEAAAVGMPDEEWGQRVAAAVTVRPGERVEPEELCAWTRRHLRGSRAAELVVIRDQLPRNDTGKLMRRQVLADLLRPAAG
ncbi:MAG TPA: fatty acid--CoA ligase family protein [Pseudonocardiaceae bacterium]|nr:fatty acid--CoA ligase family protein [Pseudonocardiaceae bacterium]